jgi:hypothetical protein
LEAASESIVPEEPDWTFSVDIEPMERFEWDPGLAELRVTVVKTAEGSKSGKPFSLTRWIRYSSAEKKPGEGINRPAGSPNSRPIRGGLRS